MCEPVPYVHIALALGSNPYASLPYIVFAWILKDLQLCLLCVCSLYYRLVLSASENIFDLAATSDLKPFPWANRRLGFYHSSKNWSNNKTFLFQINKRNNKNDRPRFRCITSILKLNYSMHVRQWATLYDQKVMDRFKA
jgi:hypothetical protein